MKYSENNKILFYTENYEHGGNNKYLFDLCTLAAEQGFSAEVFTNLDGIMRREESWFTKLNIATNSITIFSWQELRSKLNLRKNILIKTCSFFSYKLISPLIWIYQIHVFCKILKKQKPDLVFACNGGYPAGGSVLRFVLAAYISKLPVMLSIVALPSKSKWDQWRILFWNLIIPKISNKIIVNSRSIISALTNAGFRYNNFEVFHNGLPSIEQPFIFKNNEIKKVLFFSRLEKSKGISDFLQAVSQIEKCSEKVEFHFYGIGSYQSEIETLVQSNSEKFFYHGFYEGDLFSLFSQYDIYVLPSYMEGLPYTVLEAMRAGCAVIATNIGGLPELIDDQLNGLLITPGDTVKLRQCLLSLITNKELRAFISQNAVEKFRKHFDIKSIFKNKHDLFQVGTK